MDVRRRRLGAARRQPDNPLCVREPRIRSLAGDARAVARTPLLTRRCGAAAAAHGRTAQSRQGRRARAPVGNAGPRIGHHAHRRPQALLPWTRRLALARTRSIAEVASLIWTGRFDALSETPVRRHSARQGRRRPRHSPRGHSRSSRRRQRTMRRRSTCDRRAWPQCGWRILHLLTLAATRRVRQQTGADDRSAAGARMAAPRPRHRYPPQRADPVCRP